MRRQPGVDAGTPWGVPAKEESIAMLTYRKPFLLLLIGVCLLSILPSGCGGGTDSSEVRILQGTAAKRDQQAFPELLVSVVETGATTETDASGDFILPLPDEESAVTIRFEDQSGGLKADAPLTGLPSGEILVSADFVVNDAENTAEVVRVSVSRPTRTPEPTRVPDETPATPTPVPVPTEAPAPTATTDPGPQPTMPQPTPTDAPSATPTPVPADPTSTPSPTPTRSPACDYDLNGDGIVNGTDYQVAADRFANGTFYDVNGDGAINSTDVSAFITLANPYFGQTCNR